MRIAIFDYQIDRNNPIGGCHLRLLRGLAQEHDFTVFSVLFDNPDPSRIKWVRIPAPRRPLPLLFLSYHLLAPLKYWMHLIQTRERFDIVQMVETNLSFGTIAYTHFCHTSYLKHHWGETKATGFRGLSRWLDHWLHALPEKGIYDSTKQILVPSKGLAEELATEFPATLTKTRVLPNAIDVRALQRPSSFDREGFRKELGFGPSNVVFVFTALGHFERKGLPILLQALSQMKSDRARLLVVGGTNDLIEKYRARVRVLGLEGRVVFVGMQSDVRPYLWASDAFALASNYETFSLVAFEAAAASLPLITPRLHGIDEIARDGETGLLVDRTVDDFACALARFVELDATQRAEMGGRACLAASQYDEQTFVNNWRRFYDGWKADPAPTAVRDSSAQPAASLR